MIETPERVDVLIIGAGPAGSVAASLLARAGRRVLVVERSSFPRHVIGESLLPRCLDLLDAAGLLERVVARGYETKHGATFFREGKLQRFAFRDNLPGDFPYAYQVPRDDFDQTLATGAHAQGADVRFGVTVKSVTMGDDAEPLSTVVLHDEFFQRESIVRARFILDASGPARVLARAFDLEEPADILARTARYTHVVGDVRPEGDSAGDIFVTLHTNGAWLWVIPFSNGRTSVGVVAKESVFDEMGGTESEKFWSIVRGEPAAAARLREARQAMPTQVLRGWSTRTKRLSGKGFAIAGNAGDFLDPVFSSGVMFALESGSLAANLALRELAGESVDWSTDYEGVLKQAVDVFRTFVNAWYTGELPELFFFDKKPMSAIRHITSILGGNVRNTLNPFVAGDARTELDRMLLAIRRAP